jgi:hypothetical protein
MANYGKYYIAVRLLLLKQYLKVNAGKTRIIRAVHPHFVNKTPLKTQKQESHHPAFPKNDVLPAS